MNEQIEHLLELLKDTMSEVTKPEFLDEYAAGVFRLYESFQKAGFTKQQAFQLTQAQISGSGLMPRVG